MAIQNLVEDIEIEEIEIEGVENIIDVEDTEYLEGGIALLRGMLQSDTNDWLNTTERFAVACKVVPEVKFNAVRHGANMLAYEGIILKESRRNGAVFVRLHELKWNQLKGHENLISPDFIDKIYTKWKIYADKKTNISKAQKAAVEVIEQKVQAAKEAKKQEAKAAKEAKKTPLFAASEVAKIVQPKAQFQYSLSMLKNDYPEDYEAHMVAEGKSQMQKILDSTE